MNLPEAKFPDEGALRVSPHPAQLPSRPRPGEAPGRNRFDDPQGEFVVRYLADNLRGCLVELLARLREDEEAKVRLARVEYVDESEEPALGSPDDAFAEWLPKQRVAIGRLLDPGIVVALNDSGLLVDLSHEPLVYVARVTVSRQLKPDDPNYLIPLDQGTIRLGDDIGRTLTQAVSRTLWERSPAPIGIAYKSRVDDDERCWAIYGHARMEFPAEVALSPADSAHRQAVLSAAEATRLNPPERWRNE